MWFFLKVTGPVFGSQAVLTQVHRLRLPEAMGMAPELTGGSAGIRAFGIGSVCVWELLACAALRLQVTRGKWPIRLFPRRCGLSYGEGL
jgi:hypothetical protein